MKATKPIESFSDLHDALGSYGKSVMIYRGVKDVSFDLSPVLGRLKRHKKPIGEQDEKTILRLFKEQALPYLNFRPTSDWDWLAIARHHGLPTRLLDWSRNPLVAAYFAVEEKHDADSVIYAYHIPTFINTDKYIDPFALTKVGKFIPAHVTKRITAQSGVFTVHPDPKASLKSADISRLVIKKKYRNELRWNLYQYGIHRASLFPDADGLSSHIQWLRSDSL